MTEPPLSVDAIATIDNAIATIDKLCSALAAAESRATTAEEKVIQLRNFREIEEARFIIRSAETWILTQRATAAESALSTARSALERIAAFGYSKSGIAASTIAESALKDIE